jgi:hypothetical protein
VPGRAGVQVVVVAVAPTRPRCLGGCRDWRRRLRRRWGGLRRRRWLRCGRGWRRCRRRGRWGSRLRGFHRRGRRRGWLRLRGRRRRLRFRGRRRRLRFRGRRRKLRFRIGARRTALTSGGHPSTPLRRVGPPPALGHEDDRRGPAARGSPPDHLLPLPRRAQWMPSRPPGSDCERPRVLEGRHGLRCGGRTRGLERDTPQVTGRHAGSGQQHEPKRARGASHPLEYLHPG